MNDPLDDDIKRLLGDVVATTPEPPTLEERTMMNDKNDPTPTNRWIVGGGIGLVAAAAAIGLFVVTNDTEDAVTVGPADTSAVTSPPTAAETVPTPAASSIPVAPAPTTATTDSPATSEATTTDASVPTDTSEPPTSEPTSPPVVDPAEQSAALTTAGDFGVTVGVPEGSESLIITEPMAFAVTAQDGRIFSQRPASPDGPGVLGEVVVIDATTSEITPLDVPRPADGDPGDSVTLHDVATVDGEVTLLYATDSIECFPGPNAATDPSDGVDPNACIGTIMTWQPDTGESTEVVSQNSFEGSWSSLDLADNGLIVGNQFSEGSNGIVLASIGPVSPPTPADLGLEDFYFDCDVCPSAYTVDPSGRYIGWVDSGQGVTQEDVDPNALPPKQITVVDISADGAFAQQRIGVDVSAVSGLDIADIVVGDEGFVNGQAALRGGGTDADGNPIPPVKVDLTSGEIGEIDALSATLGELLLPR